MWSVLPQPFLAKEAFAAGLTSQAIWGAVKRREIVSVARNVYAVTTTWTELTPPDLHYAMARAAWASVPNAVVSHQSAALILGLPHPVGPLGKPTVTVPESTRSSSKGDWRRVLQAAQLPKDHVEAHAGLEVTSPARTVVDALRQLRLRDALAIADRALAEGMVDLGDLQQMRAFQVRWPGVRNADIGLPLIDPRRESWLESASVATAHGLGYSKPESQVWIHYPDGRPIGRVDFVWRHAGVIGEADGLGKYQGDFAEGEWDAEKASQVMMAERDRERELESVGFAVARWGTGDLLKGGGGLGKALQAAGRRASPGRIRCLWRRDVADELQPWSSDLTARSDDGPHAA